MKKILFALLLATACTGCHKPGYYADYYIEKENAMYGWEYLDTSIKYRTVTIKGHEYLIFVSDLHNIPAVVHSESCNCKNKKR